MFDLDRDARTNPAHRWLQTLAIVVLLLPINTIAEPGSPLGPGQALQVIVGLAIVLALIAAVAWLTRRMHTFRPQGSGHIRVIEGLSVGAREKLLLVQVDGRRVLLGMCPGRIEALHAFSSDESSVDFEQTLAEVACEEADTAA